MTTTPDSPSGPDRRRPSRRVSLFLAVGWTLLAALVFYVYTHTSIAEGFDPYAILNLDSSLADDAAVKKAFKRMALKYHPGTPNRNT